MNYLLKLLFLLIGSSPIFATTISGTISDAVNHTAIDSAMVAITLPDPDGQDTVFTDTAGNWSYTFTPAGIAENPVIPTQLLVEQNYPNPFNPATEISFAIFQPGEIRIMVHNILGQQVDARTAVLTPGHYQVKWDSRGSAGVYFYTIATQNTSITRKMIQLDSAWGQGLAEPRYRISKQIATMVKTAPVAITIIVSKFAYVADTQSVAVAGGEHFPTALATIHSRATMIDLHNDIIYKIAEYSNYHLKDRHNYYHTDITRLREGGVDIQFFALWIDPSKYPSNPYQRTVAYARVLETEFALAPEQIQQARTASEALAINTAGKIAGVMAVEGGHSIENSIDKLRYLYEAGMRYLTVTWNNSTDWAISAEDSRSRTVGLSEFGKTVIKTMDSLGIIIDVSHTGIKTIQDILAITKNPIIASHSGVRALRNHFRNLYDDQIVAIASTGGVIGVVFYPSFLAPANARVDINTVIGHIDYIVNLVGIDHVAIGSDFDGIGTTPIGLENTSRFPNLTLALLQHGYTRAQVEKILGGNFLRVFKQCCR